jgi:hypothetical protein
LAVVKVQSVTVDADKVYITFASGKVVILDASDYDQPVTEALQSAMANNAKASTASSSSAPPSDAEATAVINRKCKTQWATDFEMQKYCRDQQQAALGKLRRRPMASGNETTIRKKCASEWPDDFEMREYCEGQQLEALRALR